MAETYSYLNCECITFICYERHFFIVLFWTRTDKNINTSEIT